MLSIQLKFLDRQNTHSLQECCSHTIRFLAMLFSCLIWSVHPAIKHWSLIFLRLTAARIMLAPCQTFWAQHGSQALLCFHVYPLKKVKKLRTLVNISWKDYSLLICMQYIAQKDVWEQSSSFHIYACMVEILLGPGHAYYAGFLCSPSLWPISVQLLAWVQVRKYTP